ncbi:IS110 family transposase [Arthrobacter sp. MYb224]|uniref:IS110 family transposase n=1 Tax=Arthrobacter sp. MYb224 TaxID=1848600 RepID=UPI000CFB6C9E|nr:IS110 family transposase [Arthrobacter sp. MYb224]PRA00198.1 IS110 family transposase [Arthrobacter sp. MYb224]
MTIVAEKYDYVIGIDTHAQTHTYAIINTHTGAREHCQTFPVTTPGMNRAVAWIRRNIHGESIAAVEGTRSYGATISHALTQAQIEVVEAKPPRRKDQAGKGKSDEIDATAAAMSILPKDITKLLQPRSEGVRAALSILSASRGRIDAQRTINRNSLSALLRTFDLGIDARRSLTPRQIKQISGWREHSTDGIEQCFVREEAKFLATSILNADQQLKENSKAMSELDEQLAPELQQVFGLGPVTTAWILIAYSHHGRVRSEAAFAALAGVAPLQASSGKHERHRLNRSGDRQLNKALDVVAQTRMGHDEATKEYVEKRTAEGLGTREIRRILKRYICRSIFRKLEVLTA